MENDKKLETLEDELEKLKRVVDQVLSEVMVMKIIQMKEKSFSPCRRADAIREGIIRNTAAHAKYQRRKALGSLTTKRQTSEWVNQNLIH